MSRSQATGDNNVTDQASLEKDNIPKDSQTGNNRLRHVNTLDMMSLPAIVLYHLQRKKSQSRKKMRQRTKKKRLLVKMMTAMTVTMTTTMKMPTTMKTMRTMTATPSMMTRMQKKRTVTTTMKTKMMMKIMTQIFLTQCLKVMGVLEFAHFNLNTEIIGMGSIAKLQDLDRRLVVRLSLLC